MMGTQEAGGSKRDAREELRKDERGKESRWD